MTAPPREPDAWMYTKEGQEPCFNGHGRRFETYGKEWTEVPLYAAPAPSADQDQNGGQGHEAYVHCSLGALPLESGNAREATCLNTEPSARTGTDTQQGQLGANAGSISAPPTSTPAAQLAEPVLPCAIDGCKQPSLMPASEYCSLHSAIGTSPTGGEFATQPAEPREPVGASIIVTGPTGCGKSFVMELIYRALRDAGLHPYSNDLAHEQRTVASQPLPSVKVWELIERNTHRRAPAAEPPATDVDDECERLFWSFKAKSDPTQTQTPLSERDAFKRTVRPILLAATYAINKELRATVERQAREIARWDELHRVIAEELDCDTETWPDHRNAPLAIAATFMLIKQRAERAERERDELRAARIAYASEFPTNTDGEPDTGSIHANIRALKAERDALREQLHLRTCERDEAQACITTSADTIAALRECVKAADAMYALTEHTGSVSDCAKCNVADDYLAARAKVKP